MWFLRGGVDGEEVVGKVMLVNGVVSRNDGGKTVVVKVCRNEEERVEVLKEVFGIGLIEEEVVGVRGRNVKLLGS